MHLSQFSLNEVTSQKGFKVIHLNIRSLVNKYEQLKYELENNEVDIFSISESWLTEGVSTNILNITGYNLIRHDRHFIDVDTGLPKRGGGLCIYYNKHLNCDVNKWERYNISNCDVELQVVEFHREKARNILFLNVYRPPNGNVENMVNCLNLALTNIPRLDRKDIVVMGDFNVNMSSYNIEKRKLTRFGQLNNLEQLVKQPTRTTSTTANILDLIFCNMTHVHSSGIIDMFLSDHVPVYIVKKMNTKKKKNSVTFTGRTYRNYTTDILHEKINNNMNFEIILNNENPTEIWNTIYDSLVSIADEIVPKRDYKVKKEKPAWLTDELLNMKNDRDYFFKKAKITGDKEDWFVARNLRNRVNISMRVAKADYIKDQLERNRKDPKKSHTFRNTS